LPTAQLSPQLEQFAIVPLTAHVEATFIVKGPVFSPSELRTERMALAPPASALLSEIVAGPPGVADELVCKHEVLVHVSMISR
jgi:hypothetical protein